MRDIIIGLIICVMSNDHIFGNVVLIEQDITFALEATEEENMQKSSFNETNGDIRIQAEPYTSRLLGASLIGIGARTYFRTNKIRSFRYALERKIILHGHRLEEDNLVYCLK